MPAKKTNGKPAPKRTYRKKKFPISKVQKRPYGMNGGAMPMRFYTRFRWTETFTLSNSAGPSILAGAIYNLNSLYDPRHAAGGTQPRLFDQLSAIYSKYRVYGCKITCEPVITSTGNNGRVIFGMQAISGSTALVVDQKAARESIGCKNWTLSNQTRTPKISKYFDCAAVTGFSRKAYNAESDFAARYDANPVNLARVYIYVGSPDNATAASVTVNLEMVFYAVLFERNTVTSS